jgi:hypothetical protein
MDEHVLKGNSAILKCHIPSFVSDFVLIDAWIDEESGEEFKSDLGERLGTNFANNFHYTVVNFCCPDFDFFIMIFP